MIPKRKSRTKKKVNGVIKKKNLRKAGKIVKNQKTRNIPSIKARRRRVIM